MWQQKWQQLETFFRLPSDSEPSCLLLKRCLQLAVILIVILALTSGYLAVKLEHTLSPNEQLVGETNL